MTRINEYIQDNPSSLHCLKIKLLKHSSPPEVAISGVFLSKSKGYMLVSDSKPRVIFFVDGFNLYHSVREAEKHLPEFQLKWLNIAMLCTSYLKQIGGGAQAQEVHYFTAYADHLRKKNPEKIDRHKAFVRALTACKVKVHINKFKRKRIWSDEPAMVEFVKCFCSFYVIILFADVLFP